MAEVDAASGLNMIQVRRLQTFGSLGVGVVEDPVVSGEIAQVAGSIQNAVANLRDRSAFSILEQEVAPFGIAKPVFGLRQNVLRIAPDEV